MKCTSSRNAIATALSIGLLVAGIAGGFGIGYLLYTPQINTLQSSVDSLEDELSKAESQIQSLTSERDEKMRQLQQTTAELIQTKDKLADTEKKLADTERELTDTRERLDAKTAEAQSLAKQVQDLTSERDRLRSRIDSLESEISQLRNDISNLNLRISALQGRVSELEAIASPFINGRWQQIARIQRIGLGQTAAVDPISIPVNSAVRLRCITNAQIWGWAIAGPPIIGPWVGSASAKIDFYLYSLPQGSYSLISIAEEGATYEIIVEVFIPS